MYLHEDKELFREVLQNTAKETGQSIAVVEKDYYVTMILKLLSEKCSNVVFKGGTSLSKAYHIINRFSEDIDITFTEHVGEAKRKKLKYNIMKSIETELGLSIENWDKIESDKDYNYYVFVYHAMDGYVEESLYPGVKVETALASYSFPTEEMEIDSYVRQYLQKDNQDIAEEYSLNLFKMKVQAMERTYIDKVFALCDYYMTGKSKRYSRHLYDIAKMTPRICFNSDFIKLVKEVRLHRATMTICPSAKENVNISDIIHEFVANEFF